MKELTNKEKLIKELKDYILFLNDEINDLIGIAYVNGWRSTRVKEGISRREKIAKLEKEIDDFEIKSKCANYGTGE